MIILGGGVVKHHIANANLMVSRDEHLDCSVGVARRTAVQRWLRARLMPHAGDTAMD